MARNADPDIALHGRAPASALYRSRFEIHRILQAVAAEHDPVCANVGEDKLFVAQLLAADPSADDLFLSYGPDKSVNSLLLGQSSVALEVHHHGARITFDVSDPSETLFNGEPAIRFVFPKALILSSRREQPRIRVTSELSLRCVADDAGIIPFEARIVDISLNGVGCLMYDREIRLSAGTVLKGSRIAVPGGNAVVADLEVLYTTLVTDADGNRSWRAGFRFVTRPQGIEELIGMFVRDLDAKD